MDATWGVKVGRVAKNRTARLCAEYIHITSESRFDPEVKQVCKEVAANGRTQLEAGLVSLVNESLRMLDQVAGADPLSMAGTGYDPGASGVSGSCCSKRPHARMPGSLPTRTSPKIARSDVVVLTM